MGFLLITNLNVEWKVLDWVKLNLSFKHKIFQMILLGWNRLVEIVNKFEGDVFLKHKTC